VVATEGTLIVLLSSFSSVDIEGFSGITSCNKLSADKSLDMRLSICKKIKHKLFHNWRRSVVT
jgi:hypothetical protein